VREGRPAYVVLNKHYRKCKIHTSVPANITVVTIMLNGV
jgi:hypothetical protein